MASAASHEFRPSESVIAGVLLAVLAVGVFVFGLQAAAADLARPALGAGTAMELLQQPRARLRRRADADQPALRFIGALLGTLIGVLPGIGPVATIAMLLPATYALPPVSALIMLAGIYYGAQYGGSTTAILVNLPGESSSVVTCLDGYQMARQGRAGAALATAALGSFFAGTARRC